MIKNPITAKLDYIREHLYNGLHIHARDDGYEFTLTRPEGDIFLEAGTFEDNLNKLVSVLKGVE